LHQSTYVRLLSELAQHSIDALGITGNATARIRAKLGSIGLV